MKNKFLLFYLLIFFLPFTSLATHIVGGSLTYEQLGGSTYRVTLKLYRDCRLGSAAFPNPVKISVTTSDGTPFTTINIPFPGASSVPPNIDTCAVDPGICLEEAVYTKIVSGLTPGSGGYHMYYQYCCRNSTLLNIVSPLAAGETWYAHIPDNSVVISNSSPKWVNPPPVFVCAGNNMSVDHSATDADGDSLVYSLYTPYDDQPITYPGDIFTTPSVTWLSTYGADNPLDSSIPNSLTISPDGILHGVPPTIGQFVAGVRCEEWRDGTKIGEILRDFQFNVVSCPPLATASFNSIGACNGTAISFINTSAPLATTSYWDFGDGSTFADTSMITNPNYTYPSLGIYTAMLIINKGTPCADTTIGTVNISFVNAAFSDDGPACQGVVVNFTDSSTVDTSSSITSWDWDFGDGTTSTLVNPSHAFTSGGAFNVTLITSSASGCKDTIVHIVNIQGLPVANAGNDTASCANSPAINLGGTILNAGGGVWIGGAGGIFTPGDSVLNPTYTPSAGAVINGADTLLLITINNALCPADTDQVIINFYPGPTVNAGADIIVCKDTIGVPVCGSINMAMGGIWQTTGTGYFVNDTLLCTSYIPSTADTASTGVTVYLTSTGNGACVPARDSVSIAFTPTPTVDITSGNIACASNPIGLNVNVSTNHGLWTSSGTGSFAPNDTTKNGVYNPSTTDDTNGNVTLIFTSYNNTGCRPKADTLLISLIPSPTAVYSSTTACAGDSIVFTDASTSTGTIVGWNWDFGDLSPASNLQNPLHPFHTGGPQTVSLVVTSDNGCVDTLTQVVDVYYKPNVRFYADGYCLNSGTTFADSSSVIGATVSSWLWEFGDGTANTTIHYPFHYYPTGGNFNATLIITSSQGCIDSLVLNQNILPGPTANFESDSYIANQNQTIHFTDQSSNGALYWFWDFGDGSSDSSSSLQNPSHAYTQGGRYNVCEYATDIKGCVDTICKQEIISLPPVVPTGFSPNGDGQNDIFYVYGGPFKTLSFRIYNNWGELVFESTDQETGWDGKRNGADQPAGVYVYTIIGVTEDNETHKVSGDVTLLR